MSDKKVCSGCGAELQSTDPNLPGYIPANVDLEQTGILCQRCFKLKHYNTNTVVKVDEQEFLKTLEIPAHSSVVLYVLDAFNFHGSLIKDINRIANGNPVVIVVNKFDVFPKSINENRLRHHLAETLKKQGIHYDKLVVISAKHNYNFDDLLNRVICSYREKNMYLVGAANVGKSSIINALLHDYCNKTKNLITTSYYPGTTIQILKIPFIDNRFLYDTPGLYSESNIYHYVDTKNLKYILPTKEIKPVSFQLNPQQSLYLGSICRIDYLEGPRKTPFIVYANALVKLTRTKYDEKADAKFEKAMQDPNIYPKAKNLKALSDLQQHKISLESNHRMSLCINGLAFVDILGTGIKLEVYAPKGVTVEMHPSFIGGEEHADR